MNQSAVASEWPLNSVRVSVEASAAQVDALAFAELAVDDDAGHALQRLGEILVREFADVFGVDRVDHADRFALGLERFAQAAADAGDHDLFDLARVRRLCCAGPLPAVRTMPA